MEQNGLSNFGRGSPKEHFYEMFAKSLVLLEKCPLKTFLFLNDLRVRTYNLGTFTTCLKARWYFPYPCAFVC